LRMKPFVLGCAAYIVVTFPLAVIWHLVLFKTTYDRLGYFSREEPIISLGFLAIAVQGAVLSCVYPFFRWDGSVVKSGLRFGVLLGVYHWSGHVAAAAAKHSIAPLTAWFCIETIYLALQFGLTGLAIALIHQWFTPDGDGKRMLTEPM